MSNDGVMHQRLRLSVHSGRLLVDAPSGILTPELRTTLANQNTVLLDSLQELQTPATDGILSELLCAYPVVRVQSQVVGEDVLWVADDVEIPADNDLVVYREAELRELVGKTPEDLRRIHEVKKGIDGEVVDTDDYCNGAD
jgi:hypothetical protein